MIKINGEQQLINRNHILSLCELGRYYTNFNYNISRDCSIQKLQIVIPKIYNTLGITNINIKTLLDCHKFSQFRSFTVILN